MTSKAGGRDLTVRLKSGKGRSAASKRWLTRQLNDPYVARARREGYRSRAAYKLAEIDDKYRLFKPGAKVADLGAAPGGWSQIAAERVGATGRASAYDEAPSPAAAKGTVIAHGEPPSSPSPLAGEGRGGGSSDRGTDMRPSPTPTRGTPKNASAFFGDPANPSPQGGGEKEESRAPARRAGAVVAIDLLDMPAIPGVTFLKLDFLDPAAPGRLKELLGGPADVVMSDMAANATGHRKTDHLKIVALAEAAALFAREVLRPGGAFLCKVLQGGTEGDLLATLKRDFAVVRHVKPAASRTDSAELYVLATGFRGTGGATE
jgi:23S rRNA U2552 (ribose-2'-O)-methylase RlmE/FtsJ